MCSGNINYLSSIICHFDNLNSENIIPKVSLITQKKNEFKINDVLHPTQSNYGSEHQWPANASSLVTILYTNIWIIIIATSKQFIEFNYNVYISPKRHIHEYGSIRSHLQKNVICVFIKPYLEITCSYCAINKHISEFASSEKMYIRHRAVQGWL